MVLQNLTGRFWGMSYIGSSLVCSEQLELGASLGGIGTKNITTLNDTRTAHTTNI